VSTERPLVGCALHDGADIDACGCPALDSPGAIAYRGLLVKARAEIARLTAERNAAIAHRSATNEEIKKLHAIIKRKGFSVEDSVALNEFRDEAARLTAELAAARAEVDCGQDGPCAKAPGCARHWQARNRELVDELAAARAVPADVEAAIIAYRDAAQSFGMSALIEAGNHLRTAIARAISDATAARGTVGGQTGPVGKLLGSHAIVEWYLAPDWYQARIAQHRTGTVKGADLRWRHENARGWSSWGQPWGRPGRHMDQPARLVPAAEADADPNQRGPLPKGG